MLIIIAIISIVLILFVLVQNPKGGGLNSDFGSVTQLGGAKRTTDILEKGTWGLAIGLALLCLILVPNYKVEGANGTPLSETDAPITVQSDLATPDAAE